MDNYKPFYSIINVKTFNFKTVVRCLFDLLITRKCRIGVLLIFQIFSISYNQCKAQLTNLTYSYDNSNFCNPERGFYKYSQNNLPVSLTSLNNYRSVGYTLLYRIYYIDNSGPLSPAMLTSFNDDMATIRNGGMKVILRFAYTSTDGNDAPVSTIVAHLDQLQPYLQSNYDVIALLQAGFIGRWGEWYYTENFGDQGVVSPIDWANRATVLSKELSVLPPERMIAIRTLLAKMTILSRTTPITSAEAYNGTDWARVGYHDDAFMANEQDWGTFPAGQPDRDFFHEESSYLVAGGESESGDQTINECSNTELQISYLNFSYVHRDYNTITTNKWVTEGCLPTFEKKLGYRFFLTSGTFTNIVKPGGIFSLNMNLTNEGYAAPFNPRLAEIILRNQSDGKECKFQLNVEPRRWLPGNININTSIGIPSNFPNGTYDVFLNLPDPTTSLYANPEYSIRLANTGTWEAATGYNDLGYDLVINASQPGSDYSGGQWFESCYGVVPIQLLSFTAKEKSKSVLLSWNVVSNGTLDHFVVQRSTDGIHFTTITTLTYNGEEFYSCVDASPSERVWYYRLVQVDENGESLFSNIICINVFGGLQLNAYIAPTTNQINLTINSEENEEVQLMILDVTGKVISSMRYAIEIGANTITIFDSEIKIGTYFLKAQTCKTNLTKTAKIVVL